MTHQLKKFLATFLTIILILPLSLVSLFLNPSPALAADTDVVINEVLAYPSSGNEKIELYNRGSDTVDISGWRLEQSTGTNPIPTVGSNPFDPGTSLVAGAYYVVETSSAQLANSGETITLKNALGTQIDRVTYPALASGVSYARKPDGTGTFVLDSSPTLGTANNTLPPAPTLSSPADGAATSDDTPDFNWNSVTDPDGDTVSYRIVIGGAVDTLVGTTSFTPVTSLSEGQYSWRVAAYDGYEYGSFSSSRTLIIDTSAPSSTVTTSGTYGPNTWPGSISGTANDTLSSVTSVSLEIRRPDGQYWNGAGWQVGVFDTLPTIGTTSWSYAMAVSAFTQDGTHTVTPTAKDTVLPVANEAVGNPGSFIWDATPPFGDPSNFSSSPGINVPTNGKIEVSWGTPGSDALSGVDGYSYSFTQGAIDIPDTTKDIEENVSSATSGMSSDGNWWFHIRTRDNAENWTATSHYGPFIIDTVAPDVPTLLDPTADKTVNQDKYTIKGANEEKATIKVYKDSNNNNQIDEDEIVVATTKTTATGFELEVYLEQDAANYFLVTATDLAGNESAPADVPAIVEDSQPPSTLTTTSPVSQRIKHDGDLVFEGQTEPGAEVTVEIFSVPLKRSTKAGATGFWKIVVKAKEVGPGSHRVVLTIVDLAGNKSQSLLGSFRILSPMPLISEEIARAALRAIVPEAKAAPPAEAKAPEGQIKAGEAPEEAAARTSRIVTLIALLIIALGVGTAGYYAYSWWAEGTQIREREALRPMEPEKKRRPRGKPRGRPRGRTPPSARW